MRRRPSGWLLLLPYALPCAALSLAACTSEALAPSVGDLRITPRPLEGRQGLLEDPPGIDYGEVPLFGAGIAEFDLENLGPGLLDISSLTLVEPIGGTYEVTLAEPDGTPVELPIELTARLTTHSKAKMTVTFRPTTFEISASARLDFATDGGEDQNAVVSAQLRGQGLFIGEPNLEVSYRGQTYTLPEDCDAGVSDRCVLPALDFGNIQLSGQGTNVVTLANRPLEGCALPDFAGQADCSPVCVLTLDRGTQDVGFGFVPSGVGFSLSGSSALPFELGPEKPQCAQAPTAGLFRGSQGFVINFDAPATEGEASSSLIVETDDPLSPLVEIPLYASVREAPIAVAMLQPCDSSVPAGNCSVAGEIRPLTRVFFNGLDSFDPRNPADPTLITSYLWSVEQKPSDADPALFDMQGQGSGRMSIWLPLVGTYVVKLTVQNDLGIDSGDNPEAYVELEALPDSRFHIQLVWDHPTNDQDLHVVYGDAAENEPFTDGDCWWDNCRPCQTGTPGCSNAVQWYDDLPAFAGPNPHLDIDDTNGLGPENVNIDQPREGDYQIWVHYYGLVNPLDTPTRVTLRVYVDGIQAGQYGRTLRRNDLWAVARVRWNADNTATLEPAVQDAQGEIGTVKQANGLALPPSFGNVFP